MEAQTEPEVEVRIPLSRERVLRAAVGLADEAGIESLTMRRLAERLGSEPMSLYYHVANKDALLDGVADLILGEIIDVTSKIEISSGDWKQSCVRGSWRPVKSSCATRGHRASSSRGPI